MAGGILETDDTPVFDDNPDEPSCGYYENNLVIADTVTVGTLATADKTLKSDSTFDAVRN